jgi:hypothetical protein
VSRGRPAPAQRTNGAQWALVLVAGAVILRWPALGSIGVVLAYGLVCAWWPIATCGRCSGSGKLFAPIGRAFRTCPRCEGNGSHVRYGRQLFDWANH